MLQTIIAYVVFAFVFTYHVYAVADESYSDDCKKAAEEYAKDAAADTLDCIVEAGFAAFEASHGHVAGAVVSCEFAAHSAAEAVDNATKAFKAYNEYKRAREDEEREREQEHQSDLANPDHDHDGCDRDAVGSSYSP